MKMSGKSSSSVRDFRKYLGVSEAKSSGHPVLRNGFKTKLCLFRCVLLRFMEICRQTDYYRWYNHKQINTSCNIPNFQTIFPISYMLSAKGTIIKYRADRGRGDFKFHYECM